jgi:hypothetical protein
MRLATILIKTIVPAGLIIAGWHWTINGYFLLDSFDDELGLTMTIAGSTLALWFLVEAVNNNGEVPNYLYYLIAPIMVVVAVVYPKYISAYCESKTNQQLELYGRQTSAVVIAIRKQIPLQSFYYSSSVQPYWEFVYEYNVAGTMYHQAGNLKGRIKRGDIVSITYSATNPNISRAEAVQE